MRIGSYVQALCTALRVLPGSPSALGALAAARRCCATRDRPDRIGGRSRGPRFVAGGAGDVSTASDAGTMRFARVRQNHRQNGFSLPPTCSCIVFGRVPVQSIVLLLPLHASPAAMAASAFRWGAERGLRDSARRTILVRRPSAAKHAPSRVSTASIRRSSASVVTARGRSSSGRHGRAIRETALETAHASGGRTSLG